MKRILIALAGYALYRWWTGHQTEAVEPSVPARRQSGGARQRRQ